MHKNCLKKAILLVTQVISFFDQVISQNFNYKFKTFINTLERRAFILKFPDILKIQVMQTTLKTIKNAKLRFLTFQAYKFLTLQATMFLASQETF